MQPYEYSDYSGKSVSPQGGTGDFSKARKGFFKTSLSFVDFYRFFPDFPPLRQKEAPLWPG